VLRVVQFDQMLATDREGNHHSFKEQSLFHLHFKQKRTTIAGQQKGGNRAAIAQSAPPRTRVVGVFLKKTTCLPMVAPVIISIKISTVDRF